MNTVLHITSGDAAGELITKSGLPGDVLVWRDILYDGPRQPGWPDKIALEDRAMFLAEATGGKLGREEVLETLKDQYAKLKTAKQYDSVVLWFDACLFDQSMLCHILTCMRFLHIATADLLCIDAFPGVEPYHGLGQLTPEQLASRYEKRQEITGSQFLFAQRVDHAFALQTGFKELASSVDPPLPWIPAAITRWLEEQPDRATGLTRLEQLALEAIHAGRETLHEIYSFVTAREQPPQYWGDITLWAKINALADREPPLARITGPGKRLPQWGAMAELKDYRVYPASP